MDVKEKVVYLLGSFIHRRFWLLHHHSYKKPWKTSFSSLSGLLPVADFFLLRNTVLAFGWLIFKAVDGCVPNLMIG